ncbi:MAG: hypothetical protein KAW88_08585 [Candidatus Cloacimonetes bacterium]|nr:hypothetical protein [Candidatus Cloacimonadota bacterium]
METFTEFKPLVKNPYFHQQREKSLNQLDINTIDAPIKEIIKGFSNLPYCFTLQSCYGHFLYNNQKNPNNIEPLLSLDKITKVEYRIAYIALCIQNNPPGRMLLQELKKIPAIDPDYVQFGCADWFWKRQVNSYALQVEPERYKTKDKITVNFQEALHIENVRNEFFRRLEKIFDK